MIGGITTGRGGAALGQHNADVDNDNEETYAGSSRGLYSEGIQEQISELTKLASSARARKPIAHFHADPPVDADWGDDRFDRYWERLEKEYGLEKQPFAEQIHIKDGRRHEHRVYSLRKENNTCVRLSHSYRRQEKLSRITEYEDGQAFTKGRHNRTVIQRLEIERPEIAEALKAAKLHEGRRPTGSLRPQERAQQVRTGVMKDDVARDAAAAWASSDNGHSFANALKEHGLTLAMGTKCPIILDEKGNAHEVGRLLRIDAKNSGGTAPKATEIHSRLDGVDLGNDNEFRPICADGFWPTFRSMMAWRRPWGRTALLASCLCAPCHGLADLR